MGLALTEGQARFARRLAAETGLNSRVIAAWMLAEESGGAAAARQKDANHNWLNIGYFDSGPGKITHDGTWSTPEKAAHATAQFLKGQKYGASQGIRNILKAGSDPGHQVAAIARSGWATNPQYGSNIHSLLAQAPAPGAAQAQQQMTPVQSAPMTQLAEQDKLSPILKWLHGGSALELAQTLQQQQQPAPEATPPSGGRPRVAARPAAGGLGSSLDTGVHAVERITGLPITARQEPGHAPGGDHDPAVKGATARDFGGDENQRRQAFHRLTQALGVKGAVYKGADINVVKDGIRYQIISRDHGTGPHLHVGMRRVG